MSNEATDSSKLSKDQLLDALDNEITKISATQTAAGWNQWAILGAIAALLWLLIDTWEKGRFELHNVLFLTLALSFSWDILRQSVARFDSPPNKRSNQRPRFYSISSILAATRSAILFQLLKYAALFLVATSLKTKFLLLPEIYLGVIVVAGFFALIISLCENFPEQPSKPNKILHRVQRIVVVFFCALEYSSVIFVWGYCWFIHDTISIPDVRFALVASGIIYLVSLSVYNRVPTVFLESFQTIRHELTFDRISLQDAISQTDLLLTGKTLSQALQPHFNKLMDALKEAHSCLRVSHGLIVNIKNLALQLEKLDFNSERHAQIRKDIERCMDENEKFSEVFSAALKKSQKIGNTFRARREHLVFLTPETVTETKIFAEQFEKIYLEMKVQSEETRMEYASFRGIMKRLDSPRATIPETTK